MRNWYVMVGQKGAPLYIMYIKYSPPGLDHLCLQHCALFPYSATMICMVIPFNFFFPMEKNNNDSCCNFYINYIHVLLLSP